MAGKLQDLIEALERDRSLDAPHRLRERSAALDRLDTWLQTSSDAGLRHRAQAVQARLEAADRAWCGSLRDEIGRGYGRAALLPWWRLAAGEKVAPDAYDWLDELLAGVLRLDEPDHAVVRREADMVFYQPTPARIAFDLLDRLVLGADDVLVDLGSGLGHVPLLTAICTGARGLGIEIEPAYVASARACARALQLANAHFVQGDAREADFAIGSVFYLYTPFIGTILRSVLDALRSEARRRAFRVCSFGPCTAVLAAEPWLVGDAVAAADRVAIFRTRR